MPSSIDDIQSNYMQFFFFFYEKRGKKSSIIVSTKKTKYFLSDAISITTVYKSMYSIWTSSIFSSFMNR